MTRLFSAVQPTGNLHLGNYLGAIKNFKKLQEPIWGRREFDDYKDFDPWRGLFCIADLHALTVYQKPELLLESIYKTAALYLACGISQHETMIYVQSSVPQHLELSWILGCNTPVGWMNRMVQFKEKSKNNPDANLGLYSYPVLMAADILLYKSTQVPVGEDQLQHLNLARDIAGAFNRNYNKELFPLPEPMLDTVSPRIMSLRDGTKKMSKSDESDYSRINLLDDADLIALKIQKAKSDSILGITYDPEKRPECSNLLNIYSAITGDSIEKIVDEFSGLEFSKFKKILTAGLIDTIKPIRESALGYLNNHRDHLVEVLQDGSESALQVAAKTMCEVKQVIGLPFDVILSKGSWHLI